MSGLALVPWLVLALGTPAAEDAGVESTPDVRDVRAFVEKARAATMKYQDRAVATANGYRLIGDDFPGMGEHWIHVGLVFGDGYDPAHPEVLTYVTLDGRPRLLGIAYVLPLLGDEAPPEDPAGRTAWHAHAASVDDETFVPHHHHSGHEEHGPRLAMVHAWIWLENPEGLFAADNWAIPFLRIGLDAPDRPAPAAGKALSLLSGGDGYVARVARTAAAPAPLDDPALRAVIARASRRIAAVVAGRAGSRLSAAELDALEAEWETMWRAIDAMLPADAVERLQGLSMR